MLFFQVVIFILCHVLIVDAKEKPLTEIIEVDTSKIDYSSAKHLPRRSKRLQKPVVYNKWVKEAKNISISITNLPLKRFQRSIFQFGIILLF